MAYDLLERMRGNPAGDWQIRDVEALCREYGLLFRPAKARRIVTPNIPRHVKS
jgi:hypothetical protein